MALRRDHVDFRSPGGTGSASQDEHRLARERPPKTGPVLPTLWEAMMQGRVRLQPEVRKLLWNLVEH